MAPFLLVLLLISWEFPIIIVKLTLVFGLDV